ncbi:MFS transporter [Acidianus sulfidivorans JP7]|uniref:MFS transporter n=1 Tax=Acidianus sulfidivorans JP7 TaxID=619593 RepID=A0A2U9IN30_9CREN|nr:MFS transporter [Acidianus sulfidivorans]AWR97479.1 MFS transporter [Acidianus sulfidivorans JP7]
MNSKFPITYAIIIVVITFALRASNNMVITTLPLIARYSFHFSDVLIGLVSSFGAIFAFISSGFVNSRLSSLSRRKIFILFSILYGLIFPFFYFSTPIDIWFFSGFLGFSLGIIMPNIMTSAGLFPDRKTRERMLSLYTLTLSTSLILGPLIESAILLRYTLFQAFLFFSIFAFLIALFSFKLKFPKEEQNMVDPNNTKFKDIFNNIGFRLAILLNLIYSMPFGMITTFGAIFAVDYFHSSYSLATALFSIFFATSFLGRLLLTIFTPKNLWNPILISSSFTILGLFLIFISPNLLFYSLSLVILGIPHGLTYPLSLVTISRSFDETKRNKANSYYSATMMGLVSFIPIIISFIVNTFGLKKSFLILEPISLVFFIFVIKLYMENKEKLNIK